MAFALVQGEKSVLFHPRTKSSGSGSGHRGLLGSHHTSRDCLQVGAVTQASRDMGRDGPTLPKGRMSTNPRL